MYKPIPIIAFAEDKEEDARLIKHTIKEMSGVKFAFAAKEGQDLIIKLSEQRNLPTIVFIDMEMPKCDGLLATIIGKRLWPDIKFVGLSTHSSIQLISEFLAEGGSGFLAKYLIHKDSFPYTVYNNPDVLKTFVDQIVNGNDLVIDVMLEYKTDLHKQLKATNQIIQTNFSHLAKDDILYLQLNAAGFDKRMIAKLMHKSESAIKKHYEKLSEYFKVNTSAELMTISLGKGITKLAKFY